jgi:hypothetical protein
MVLLQVVIAILLPAIVVITLRGLASAPVDQGEYRNGDQR